jgi:hypothetical protein
VPVSLGVNGRLGGTTPMPCIAMTYGMRPLKARNLVCVPKDLERAQSFYSALANLQNFVADFGHPSVFH